MDTGRSRFFFCCAFVFTLLLPWRDLGFHISGRMIATVDYCYHFALLSSIHRSLFDGFRALLSPPFFYPLEGISVTSELLFAQGVFFGLLREIFAAPVLAWNVTYGFAGALNAAAAYLALRGEKLSPESALFGAVLYATSNWIEILGGGVNYRAAFGLPLAWFLLSRIKEEGARPALLASLSVVMLMQFMACMTHLFSVVLIIAVRFLSESLLRKRKIFSGLGLLMIPVGSVGYGCFLLSSHHLAKLGLAPHLEGTSGQVFYRIDILNLIPGFAPGSYIGSTAWPISSGSSAWPHEPFWLAIGATAIALWQARKRTPSPGPSRPSLPMLYYVLAGLLGIFIICLALFRLTLIFPVLKNDAAILLLTSSAFWLAIIVSRHLSVKRGGLFFGSESLATCGFLLFVVSLFMALGPLIFFFGRPIMIGPLAVLDVLVPGMERMRVPARFLTFAALAVAILSAVGFEHLMKRYRYMRRFAGHLLVGALLLNLLPGFFEEGKIVKGSVALAPEACPDCALENMSEIPLPYKWLLDHAPGQPLIELPMGSAGLPRPGEPPVKGHDPTYLFYHALDGIPRLNGFTSHFPPSYLELISKAETFPSIESIKTFQEKGARWLLVHGDRYRQDHWLKIGQALSTSPPGLSLINKWGPVWLYRLDY